MANNFNLATAQQRLGLGSKKKKKGDSLNFFDFDAIRLSLASPEQIRAWSFGEVKKPETINYRTLKPERDGLFCERTFGPVRDYECACGKYRWIKFKGIVCDRCGVEVTESKVRRERMGHIELAVPVTHIWFLKKAPSRIGIVLNMRTTDLERVVYYASYIVLDDYAAPDGARFEAMQLLSEEEMRKAKDKYGSKLKVGIGAAAVEHLLSKVEPKKEVADMKSKIGTAISEGERSRLIRRLRILQGFADSGNRPEWMIMTALPVIPPELRPLVPLEGGRFATSDLNDLYRRIINRNNRLKHIEALRAPEVMIYNEKRLLQEAVDALIENGARGKVVIGAGNRPLKSLSDILKGKQGRFRQNLLGKRVDYSGRSVIVVGPYLRINQCGLPKEMALELFKPFIIRDLMGKDSLTLKAAKRMFERVRPEIWDILENVTRKHPVLLNRAPTLHRLGIQAFEPVLVEGKAIQLHPLTCTAFNADFDGDQMAVHVPLSQEAQLEARLLMMSTNNILSPASGRPIMAPTHDMVLGIHYLTKMKPGERGEGMVFVSQAEAVAAWQMGRVDLHARIKVRDQNVIMEPGFHRPEDLEKVDAWKDWTTVGRVLFNEVIPIELNSFYVELRRDCDGALRKALEPFVVRSGDVAFVLRGRFREMVPEKRWAEAVEKVERGFDTNEAMGKKELSRLVEQCYKLLGHYRTVVLLDDLKRLGFTHATRAGLSISITDMKIPAAKKQLVPQARKAVRDIERQAKMGIITESERYNKVIEIWTHVTDEVSDKIMKEELRREDAEPYSPDKPRFNSIYLMATSGARGSPQQVRQLAGMRGLMAKPQSKITGAAGEIIESPIISNLREGLTVLEYFISTHGGRKGLADTALKTADAGYLTRRLVDVAHDLVVTEPDCGTINGIRLTALSAGDEVIEKFDERMLGRVVLDEVVGALPGPDGELEEAVIAGPGEMVTAEMAEKIRLAGVELARVRSVLTCETRYGVCAKCYGMNNATHRMVEAGEAVGIVAAQSIGEPGTQLTLRTFHIGGAASLVVKRSQAVASRKGVVEFRNLQTLKSREGVNLCVSRSAVIVLVSKDEKREKGSKKEKAERREEHRLIYGARIKVANGSEVVAGELLAEWDPYALPILSEHDGTVCLLDVKEGVTLHEERNKITGIIERKIIEHRAERAGARLNPRIVVEDKKGHEHAYALPIDTIVMVEGDQEVRPGDVLAKIPQEVTKTKDITGGLPRVSELFEARKPKSSAVISEIAGVVSLSTNPKGLTQVTVRDEETGMYKEYVIPQGKHLVVYTGDRVGVGEPLSDGAINPHDILRVKGVKEVQEYLVNAIQEVYRLQGVTIGDRHIECIVRQMLKNVRIVDSGDTSFLRGQDVERFQYEEVNGEVAAKGGREAQAEPVLMGISKASLASESFVSAASFQETTRVLTEAATTAQVDTLRGLKENVIIGHMIPAGTGLHARRKEEERAAAAAAAAAEKT